MSEEEKVRKLKAIELSSLEKPPEGLVAKLKFYIKRYWYIAIPVHSINCTFWFVAFYLAVRRYTLTHEIFQFPSFLAELT